MVLWVVSRYQQRMLWPPKSWGDSHTLSVRRCPSDISLCRWYRNPDPQAHFTDKSMSGSTQLMQIFPNICFNLLRELLMKHQLLIPPIYNNTLPLGESIKQETGYRIHLDRGLLVSRVPHIPQIQTDLKPKASPSYNLAGWPLVHVGRAQRTYYLKY